MSGPSAPAPPRQGGIVPREPPYRQVRRQRSVLVMLAFFILSLSVILSFDWPTGGFRPDAEVTILIGILVAGIIYVAGRYGAPRVQVARAPAGVCPRCARSIPPDANLCPYCGFRLW